MELTVRERISKITSEVNAYGVKKNVAFPFNGNNFKGRGIDDIVLTITPLFVKHNLVLLINTKQIIDTEISIFVSVEYTIQCTKTDEKVTFTVYGEGAKNKHCRAVQIAQTYALKTFLSQAFFISEGWDEAHTDYEEVVPEVREFPREKYYLFEQVIEKVTMSDTLKELLFVFEKYKDDFLKTDFEEKFKAVFTERRQQIRDKLHESATPQTEDTRLSEGQD